MSEDYDEVKEILNWGQKEVNILMAKSRKKENKDLTASDLGIHRSIVREKSEFKDCVNHLKNICGDKDQTYRLYVSVNSRDIVKGAKILQDELNESFYHIINGNESMIKRLKKLDSEIKSIYQKNECRSSRNFLFDLDNTNKEDVETFIDRIDGDIIFVKDTPNGHHIITEPFNYQEEFENMDVDRKTDGMMFLEYL